LFVTSRFFDELYLVDVIIFWEIRNHGCPQVVFLNQVINRFIIPLLNFGAA
jgi:hypothetical protein